MNINAPEIRTMQLDALRPSATSTQIERRKRYTKESIAELADTIGKVGMLHPIVARPSNGHFEIVAGERRWLAAKAAKLDQVQVSVRELDDNEAIEVQLVENLQHEELHELAEAEGYEGLHKLGRSVEEIAEKMGKSREYVYGRMKLTALAPDARTAFYNGKINASIALLLARIPVAELQTKALEHILTPNTWRSEPLSFRDAKDYVHREFTLRLADAPFPRDRADLVPAAGTCGACPKRTGNQLELFGDSKGANICTDPKCFSAKRAAWNKIVVAEAKESGAQVITGKEAKKIVSPWSSHLQGGYVRPTDKCDADPKKRTYAQLVGKEVTPALVQNAEGGKFVKAFKAADIAPVLAKQKITLAKERAPAPKNDNKAEEAKRARRIEFQTAVLKAVYDKAPTKMSHELLVSIADDVVGQYGYGDAWTAIGLANRWTPKQFEAMKDAQLLRLIFIAKLADTVSGWRDSTELIAAAKRLRIDLKAIAKELDAKRAKPAPAKASKKKARS